MLFLGNMFAGFGTLFYGRCLLTNTLHPSLTPSSQHPPPKRDLHPQRRPLPRARGLVTLTTDRCRVRCAKRPQQHEGAGNRCYQRDPNRGEDPTDRGECVSDIVFADTGLTGLHGTRS